MRIAVDGVRAARHPRLAAAAIGLAARGHAVLWIGPPPPAASAGSGIEHVASALGAARFHADVALGAGPPLASMLRGRLAGAGAFVQAVGAEGLRRWGPLDRAAWSFASFALIEPADAEAIRARPEPLVLERVGLWSDEPPAGVPAPEHPDCEILERACERILARRRTSGPRAAVFLDRDGTLIEEVGYLSDPAQVRLLPGVAAALARLHAAGFPLVVISNQAGVGRGLFPLGRVYAAMAELRRRLRAEGVELDAVYFCPHAPEEGCACRKPNTELIERAADDLLLRATGSVMIGDKAIDVRTGKNAGVRSVLVATGYGEAERALLGPAEQPDWFVSNLGEAAERLIAASEGEPEPASSQRPRSSR